MALIDLYCNCCRHAFGIDGSQPACRLGTHVLREERVLLPDEVSMLPFGF